MKIILPILAILLLIAGCDSDDSSTGPDPNEATLNEDFTIPFTGLTMMLGIQSVNGNVSFTRAETDTIRVHVIKRCSGNSPEQAEEGVRDIHIDHRFEFGFEVYQPENEYGMEYSVDFEIALPAGMGFWVQQDNGDIDVEGCEGDPSIDITNGNIDCEMSGLRSTVVFEVENGNIDLTIPTDSRASFELGVGSGSVSVSGFSGISYTSNTDQFKSGLLGGGGASIDLKTNNGNIFLRGQ